MNQETFINTTGTFQKALITLKDGIGNYKSLGSSVEGISVAS